jgi:hypothetical protein
MNGIEWMKKFNGCQMTMLKWNEIGKNPQFPATNNGKFEVKEFHLKTMYKCIVIGIELVVLILVTYLK